MKLDLISIPDDLTHIIRRIFHLSDIEVHEMKLDIFADGNSCLVLEVRDSCYNLKNDLFLQGAILKPFKEKLKSSNEIILIDFYPDSLYCLGLNPIELINQNTLLSYHFSIKSINENFLLDRAITQIMDFIRYCISLYGRKTNINSIKQGIFIDIHSKRTSKFISYRHIEREFKKTIGYPIKKYNRIIRFQQSLAFLENSPLIKFCDLCLYMGYYDQSHFSKEFKEFSGYSPKEFLTLNKVDESLYS